MSEDRNLFGGGNPNSIYTPMSEDEREVIQRLIDADDLQIHVKQWGEVNKFQAIRLGDLRLQLEFWVRVHTGVSIPVYYFDLELRTRPFGDHKEGILLYAERQAVDNAPIWICGGWQSLFIWDIAIMQMDPKLVKQIKPGALGLTTREGNRHLNTNETKILHKMRESEKKVREHTKQLAREATKKSLY
jgi:hypothetical protein